MNTSLTHLNCHSNQLTTLDLSSNTNLVELYCYNNQLTSLNTTFNTSLVKLYFENNQIDTLIINSDTALTELGCSSNQLRILDVSANKNLQQLYCDNNQLTDLDVRSNTALTILWCNSNQLTSLNAKNGNNTNFISFKANSNPNLSCIEVDDVSYSTANWTNIDTSSSFSTDCNININYIPTKQERWNIFPNPTKGKLFLDLGKFYNHINIEITDMLGRVILSNDYLYIRQVDLQLEGNNGLYLVKIRTEDVEQTIKIIKID